MENKIRELEEDLHTPYENWTRETLIEMMSNEEVLKKFSPEIAEYLLDTRVNPAIDDIFKNLTYDVKIHDGQTVMNGYLEQLDKNEVTLEEFQALVNGYKTNNIITKLICYVTLFGTSNDYPFTDEEKLDVKQTIADISGLIGVLGQNIGDSFQTICDLLDLVYPIQELYFERFGEDILEPHKNEIETVLAELNSIMSDLLKELHAGEEAFDENAETKEENLNVTTED